MYFNGAHNFLDKLGFPRLEEYTSNAIIKNIDFAEAKAEGRIEFREDGVYLNYSGKWIRGYYYMTSYNLETYDNPRFHLFNCTTMKKKHVFKGEYVWSNAEMVDVKNREDDYNLVKDLILPLCGNCRKMLEETIDDTIDFYNSNEHDAFDITETVESINTSPDRNIFGYPLNWREIATNYKRKKGLKCNECGIADPSGTNQWFYDVHHKSRNKSDCHFTNLEILCKLCHVYKDEYHKKQAIKYPHRNEILHELVRRRKDDLLRKKNKYLKKYLKDFKEFLEED